MLLHVTAVRHLGGYRPAVTFSDGAEREVDLAGELHGPVFAPLRAGAAFTAAFLGPETRAVAWPTGADLAPESLREIGRPVATV